MHRSTSRDLLDHFVGAREQHRRHVEAERLGGLDIQNQLKLGWLQNRQIVWPRSLENSTYVGTSRSVPVCKAACVAQQTRRRLETRDIDRLLASEGGAPAQRAAQSD